MSDDIQDYINMASVDHVGGIGQLQMDEDSLSSIDNFEAEGYSTDSDATTYWDVISSLAINLVLPFINGLMLGFGEIVAHEIGFRYGWYGAKVEPPTRQVAGRRQIEKARRRLAAGAYSNDLNKDYAESKWL